MKSLIPTLWPTRTPSRKATQNRKAHLAVQELENRLTPACSFYFNTLEGTLNISGTAVADTVMISVSGSQLKIDHQSAGESTTQHSYYSNTAVRKIVFRGQGGNDTMSNFSLTPITAMGGEGDDTLTDGIAASTLYGEGGNDRLVGGHGNDILYGGYGLDTLYGDGGEDRLYGEADADRLFGGDYNDMLSGGAGNDELNGGMAADMLFGDGENDVLKGDSGNDTLYGGAGNDRLYGNDDTDRLYGEAGSDYTDAGSASEYAHGGAIADGDVNFNPYILTISGATYNDVYQNGGPTCWVDAPISEVAYKGVDLSTRITYLGNNRFRVYLYNFDSTGTRLSWTSENIHFDGTMYPAGDVKANPNQRTTQGFSETWVILTHRAILQAVSRWDPTQSPINPHSGGAAHPLGMLTGRMGSWPALNRADMSAALAAGKSVVIGTPAQPEPPTSFSPKLVGLHAYAVLSVTNVLGTWFVTVRNPWGKDGEETTTPSGDPTDGIITLAWSELVNSRVMVAVA